MALSLTRNIGLMRERLTVQTDTAASVSVSSLTRSSTTATAVTATAHGYLVGDYVTISGASPAGWNAKVKILTVPTSTSFTFACSGALTTPATGTILVVYTTNASGQVVTAWRTLATLAAELMPIGAMERYAAAQVQSTVSVRFRVWARADLAATQRILWTPTSPTGSTERALVISGVLPVGDGRQFVFLEASEVPA